VSDFVAVEARLRPLLSRLIAVAAQMSVRSTVVTALCAERLLRFVTVAAQMTLRATVVALPRVEATSASASASALPLGLVALARDMSTLATVVTALTSSAAAAVAAKRPIVESIVPVVGPAVVAIARSPVRVIPRIGSRVTSSRFGLFVSIV